MDPEYREAMLEAVRNDGMQLTYATEEIKADPEVVIEVVRQNGLALYHASRELKSSCQAVCAAVKQHPGVFCLANVDMRGDWGMVLCGMSRLGFYVAVCHAGAPS